MGCGSDDAPERLPELQPKGWEPFLDAVWHLSPPEGAIGILDDREILPSSTDREFSQPQTANSYALAKGYVALFDFRNATLAEVEEEDWKWGNYFWGRPFRVGFEIDVDRLSDDLVTWQEAKREVGYKKVWVPYYGAWSTEPLSLDVVASLVVSGPFGALPLAVDLCDAREELIGCISELRVLLTER
jgi:hypothetical protein